jgi:hypothetical protein
MICLMRISYTNKYSNDQQQQTPFERPYNFYPDRGHSEGPQNERPQSEGPYSGNSIGKSMYLSSDPCSACPSGTTCSDDKALCSA